MKLILVAIGLVVFVSCSQPPQSSVNSFTTTEKSDKLTQQQAQAALDKWISRESGSVTVSGVQEIPQENSARARLTFRNLHIEWTEGNPRQMNYSDSGTATFTHYTDGRWVLNQIKLDRAPVYWKDIGIKAN
jgi:hypothetical protein